MKVNLFCSDLKFEHRWITARTDSIEIKAGGSELYPLADRVTLFCDDFQLKGLADSIYEYLRAEARKAVEKAEKLAQEPAGDKGGEA